MEKIICLDFDGTCVTHAYPNVGEDLPHCFEVLKKLEANGVKIILWTMRSSKDLQDAIDWFIRKKIILWGINQNPDQHTWTESPKAYAPIYIDDAALGCPLISPTNSRPFVDWVEVEKQLKYKNFI